MYTVLEFRKNLRKAFNDANEGHKVVIERYDQKFQLVSLVDKPGNKLENTPIDIAPKPTIIKTPEQAKEKVTELSDSRDFGFRLCKNGHAIPHGKTRCLGKGCKYA